MNTNQNHVSEQRSASEILDGQRLKENYADDPELLQELVELFRDTSGGYLSVMHDAVTRGDNVVLEEAAHKFRGAVGNLCAKATLRAARLLEEVGRRNDMAQAEDALTNVEFELARLERALAELLGA